MKRLLTCGTVLFLNACSGGGGGGGPADVSGAYTLTYAKLGGSCAGPENPDWVQGVLQVTQTGSSVEFDFGNPYVLSGTVDASGDYEFSGDVTDAEGLLHVEGRGTFTDTAIASLDGNAPGTQGIRAEYDTDGNGSADCQVYGQYSGNKLVSIAFGGSAPNPPRAWGPASGRPNSGRPTPRALGH